MDKPNLFIAGVAKAGTSALFNAICQHPEITGSRIKEPHYFTQNISREFESEDVPLDLEEYLQLFNFYSGATFQCEASTSYFWDQGVSESIYDFNPNAKVIIVLRNPITRAYSHYEMDIHSEREKDPEFLSAILMDENKKERTWGKARLYVDLGYYSNSLSKYQSVFEHNLLVLKYEEFKHDPTSSFQQIWDFLKLDPFPITNQTVNKSTSYSKIGRKFKSAGFGKLLPKTLKPVLKKMVRPSNEKIPKDAYDYLLKRYCDDIKKLSKMGYPFYDELVQT